MASVPAGGDVLIPEGAKATGAEPPRLVIDRDPFQQGKPRIITIRDSKIEIRTKGRQYALGELVLIGVVNGEVQPVAMFRNPKGRAYMVRRGDYISSAFARIRQIVGNKVVVDFPLKRVAGCAAEQIIVLAENSHQQTEDVWQISAR